MKRHIFYALSAIAVLSLCLGFYSHSRVNTYVTWDSLEPDKWASVWLIKSHLDPQAYVDIRPNGDSLVGGITFGVPDGQFQRSSTKSTFATLLQTSNHHDPTLLELAQIITEIETMSWAIDQNSKTAVLERQFRRLQDKYQRRYVPVQCYADFFNAVYQALNQKADADILEASLNKAVNDQQCKQAVSVVTRSQAKLVAKASINSLVDEIQQGKNIVFVDVREPQEFSAGHIPHALNIPMRKLSSVHIDELRKADRVIAYCIKDFRGYEFARKLMQNGIAQAAVMDPHGLSGWKAQGLPILTKDDYQKPLKDLLIE